MSMKMTKKQEKEFWNNPPKKFKDESEYEYQKRLNIWRHYSRMYKLGMFK